MENNLKNTIANVNFNELPPEVVSELKLKKSCGSTKDKKVLEIIAELETASINDIVLAFYAKHKEALKRGVINTILSNLKKAGKIVSTMRGVYSIKVETAPSQKKEPETKKATTKTKSENK